MTTDASFLASEVKELEELLASIPDENVIERRSLETRLASARASLEALPPHPARKARLTFRGRPVLGSHGIVADFGAKATRAFSDAFTAVAAALDGALRDMGPIPDRESKQLLITGTALGSFGFEFELPSGQASLFTGRTRAEEAMEKVETLFRLAAEGSDDEVAEVVEEVHPRVVKDVREFLDLLVQQQAWCALEFDERSFRFAGHDQVKAASERLKEDNIQERQETHRGEFQGVLPASRTFEFRLLDDQGILRGKVDRAIDDPDILNREWLHQPASVRFSVMQVGQGRPRYTLMSLDDVSQ
ncbi:MAG: hypothetical protein H6841_07450 [Planctomycetes bacterium]|nr:hypothetical protein [Planctomycetota bacterium]